MPWQLTASIRAANAIAAEMIAKEIEVGNIEETWMICDVSKMRKSAALVRGLWRFSIQIITFQQIIFWRVK
jgi:hypothetical protein